MTVESRHRYELAGALVGEVLAILLGVWMISRGWENFGGGLVVIGVVGLVLSTVRFGKAMRQRPNE